MPALRAVKRSGMSERKPMRLVADRRDFEREALDEGRDALVYISAAIVRRRREAP